MRKGVRAWACCRPAVNGWSAAARRGDRGSLERAEELAHHVMHAYERFPRRRRQSLPGAQAYAQAPVHARTPRRRDSIQLVEGDARLAQGARYREGHVALVSFLCVERVDATKRLVDRRLLEDDIGEEAAVTRDDGGARVVCRTGGSKHVGERISRCRKRNMK